MFLEKAMALLVGILVDFLVATSDSYTGPTMYRSMHHDTAILVASMAIALGLMAIRAVGTSLR